MENIVTSIRREKKEKSREFLFGNAKHIEDRETIKVKRMTRSDTALDKREKRKKE